LLCCHTTASAQWATAANSTDIKNTNAGSVGVGTTDPSLGGAVASRVSVIQSDGTTGLAVGNSSGVPRFALNGNSTGSWTMYDYGTGAWSAGITQKGGRVGIGTTSPANALHVGNTLGTQAMRVSGNGGGIVNFQDTNAAPEQRLYQWRSEGGLFRMSLLNDSESTFAQQNLLVANASGNIGIGTASPTSKLHVVGGSITVQGAAGVGTGNADFAIRTASGNGYWDFAAQNTNGSFIVYDAVNNKIPVGVEANAPSNTLYLNSAGAVGVGAPPPAGSQYKLVVTGSVSASGSLSVTGAITGGTINATYQDMAEWVPSTQKLVAGTVVVLDTDKTNHVLASTKAYDTKVAGVVSDSPGVILGVGGEGKLKVATTGRVRVKVDATRAPIKVGDLLVTSDEEGVAMKSVEVELGGVKIHRPGTIVGKALEPLVGGTGEILVLLSLQ
jgi:hypothetical protein